MRQDDRWWGEVDGTLASHALEAYAARELERKAEAEAREALRQEILANEFKAAESSARARSGYAQLTKWFPNVEFKYVEKWGQWDIWQTEGWTFMTGPEKAEKPAAVQVAIDCRGGSFVSRWSGKYIYSAADFGAFLEDLRREVTAVVGDEAMS